MAYKFVVKTFFWLFLPLGVLLAVLSIVGTGDELKRGPEIPFITSVVFGQAISIASEIIRQDRWALRKFLISGLVCAITIAVLVSINKYTIHKILPEGFPYLLIYSGLIVSSVGLLWLSAYWHEKYNKQQN